MSRPLNHPTLCAVPLLQTTQRSQPVVGKIPPAFWTGFFRATRRLVVFVFLLAAAAVDFAIHVWLAGKLYDPHARCRWTSRHAAALLKCLGIRAEYSGARPGAGLLVSNHLGYLDILVLGAAQPAVFVSKAEVRNWPALGFLAGLAGTIFVRRERRADVATVNEQMSALVQAGVVVIAFPEGTSSDGQRVQPFFSSLLAPAVAGGWPVTPAFVRYDLDDGSVADEVCYWRDMTFLPHFLRLLTKHEIRAQVIFGQTRPAGEDRKQLARELHRAVRELGGV